MKRLLLVFGVIALMSVEMLAQENTRPVRLGVLASPTFSWMGANDNQVVGDGTRGGFMLGLTGEYFFQENYALVSGVNLLLSQGGGLKYNYTDGGNFWPNTAIENASTNGTDLDSITGGSILNYNMQFIEIPISLKLRSNEVGYLRYFAELPMFTLGINNNATGDIVLGGNTVTENEDISGDVNPLVLAWGLGAGAEYALTSSVSAIVGIYYKNGLTDITKNKDTQIFGTSSEDSSKATLRTLTIKIGVLF